MNHNFLSPMEIAESRLNLKKKQIVIFVTPRLLSSIAQKYPIKEICIVKPFEMGATEFPFTGERIPLYIKSLINAAVRKIKKGETVVLLKSRLAETRILERERYLYE